MPERLSIRLRLGHHGQMPEGVARTMQHQSLVDRAVRVVCREGEFHATPSGVM